MNNNFLTKKNIAIITVFSIIILSVIFILNNKKPTQKMTTKSVTSVDKTIITTIKQDPYEVFIKIKKNANFTLNFNGMPIFAKGEKIPLAFYVDSKDQAINEFNLVLKYDYQNIKFLQSVKKNTNPYFDISYKNNEGSLIISGKKRKIATQKVILKNEPLVDVSFISIKPGAVSFIIENDTKKNLLANEKGFNVFKEAIGISMLVE